MKPFAQLNNVERARLLFELFPDEIPEFLVFQKVATDDLLSDPDKLRAQWSNGFFSVDCWLQLARAVQQKLDKYKGRLSDHSRLFADNLFDGYMALYSAHCLQEYVRIRKLQDGHFKTAVEMLFT